MDPIVSIEFIVREADEAARTTARTGQPQDNPYLPGTEAAARWAASYQRQLLWHTAPEGEASA